MEQRRLGRSGRTASIITLGTSRLASVGQQAAIALVREAIALGVNVIETGWAYGDGKVEKWLGLALKDGYRERVMLVWQCGAYRRDYKTSMQQFDESLRRVGTDRFDIWSFGELIYDNDPEWLDDHGGLDAAQEARDEKRIVGIGFSGHKAPHIHMKLLQRGFAWDLVQMPLNPLDATYRSFERQVLPEAVKRGIAVISTKPIAGGAIARAKVVKPEDALRYCFSLPVSSVQCAADDRALLKKNLKLATTYTPYHAGEMDLVRQKCRPVAGDGRFERYKSTQEFDSPLGLAVHGFRP